MDDQRRSKSSDNESAQQRFNARVMLFFSTERSDALSSVMTMINYRLQPLTAASMVEANYGISMNCRSVQSLNIAAPISVHPSGRSTQANALPANGRIHGRDPLSRAQRRPDCEKGGLYRHWNQSGWLKESAWYVGRRECKHRVLGDHPERNAQPWGTGHLDRLNGQSDRLFSCNQHRLHADR